MKLTQGAQMRAFALLAALSVVAAAPTGPTHYVSPKGSYLTLLNNIALNASAGTRTFSLTLAQVEGMANLVLTVNRTRHLGTDLTMTCTHSRDGGTTNAAYDTCEYTPGSGTCTYYPVTWKSPNSTSEVLTWEVRVLGYGAPTCVVASSSADGTDLLSVTGELVTQ